MDKYYINNCDHEKEKTMREFNVGENRIEFDCDRILLSQFRHGFCVGTVELNEKDLREIVRQFEEMSREG